MRVWMRSDGQAACSTDGSNMCKVNTDFKPGAAAKILPGLGDGGTDLTLTCDDTFDATGITVRTYGVTPQALSVIQLATSKPTAKWSDLTCADMTTNMTAHFNLQYSHHLYLKSTMKEFLEAYGAACCGSLGKTRDPCEVSLSTPARAKSNRGSVLAGQHASSDCAFEHRLRWQRPAPQRLLPKLPQTQSTLWSRQSQCPTGLYRCPMQAR